MRGDEKKAHAIFDNRKHLSARQGISESGLVEEGSWGIPSAVAAA